MGVAVPEQIVLVAPSFQALQREDHVCVLADHGPAVLFLFARALVTAAGGDEATWGAPVPAVLPPIGEALVRATQGDGPWTAEMRVSAFAALSSVVTEGLLRAEDRAWSEAVGDLMTSSVSAGLSPLLGALEQYQHRLRRMHAAAFFLTSLARRREASVAETAEQAEVTGQCTFAVTRNLRSLASALKERATHALRSHTPRLRRWADLAASTPRTLESLAAVKLPDPIRSTAALRLQKMRRQRRQRRRRADAVRPQDGQSSGSRITVVSAAAGAAAVASIDSDARRLSADNDDRNDDDDGSDDSADDTTAGESDPNENPTTLLDVVPAARIRGWATVCASSVTRLQAALQAVEARVGEFVGRVRTATASAAGGHAAPTLSKAVDATGMAVAAASIPADVPAEARDLLARAALAVKDQAATQEVACAAIRAEVTRGFLLAASALRSAAAPAGSASAGSTLTGSTVVLDAIRQLEELTQRVALESLPQLIARDASIGEQETLAVAVLVQCRTHLRSRIASVSTMQRELAEISSQRRAIDEAMAAVAERCEELEHVEQLPLAFEAAIAETVRRRAFHRQFLMQVEAVTDELGRMRAAEAEARDAFARRLGRHLPLGLFPGLDERPPHVRIQCHPVRTALADLDAGTSAMLAREVAATLLPTLPPASDSSAAEREGAATMLRPAAAPEHDEPSSVADRVDRALEAAASSDAARMAALEVDNASLRAQLAALTAIVRMRESMVTTADDDHGEGGPAGTHDPAVWRPVSRTSDGPALESVADSFETAQPSDSMPMIGARSHRASPATPAGADGSSSPWAAASGPDESAPASPRHPGDVARSSSGENHAARAVASETALSEADFSSDTDLAPLSASSRVSSVGASSLTAPPGLSVGPGPLRAVSAPTDAGASIGHQLRRGLALDTVHEGAPSLTGIVSPQSQDLYHQAMRELLQFSSARSSLDDVLGKLVRPWRGQPHSQSPATSPAQQASSRAFEAGLALAQVAAATQSPARPVDARSHSFPLPPAPVVSQSEVVAPVPRTTDDRRSHTPPPSSEPLGEPPRASPSSAPPVVDTRTRSLLPTTTMTMTAAAAATIGSSSSEGNLAIAASPSRIVGSESGGIGGVVQLSVHAVQTAQRALHTGRTVADMAMQLLPHALAWHRSAEQRIEIRSPSVGSLLLFVPSHARRRRDAGSPAVFMAMHLGARGRRLGLRFVLNHDRVMSDVLTHRDTADRESVSFILARVDSITEVPHARPQEAEAYGVAEGTRLFIVDGPIECFHSGSRVVAIAETDDSSPSPASP